MPRKKEKRLTVLGKRLNALRGDRSQAEFAKHIGLTAATVGYYENSERLPDAETLHKICSACGCTSDFLLGFDATPTREMSDVCKVIPLAPEAVTALTMINNDKNLMGAMRGAGLSSDSRLSMNDFQVKAINHLIANCNEVLALVGLFLFGDFSGVENVVVKGARIDLKQADEFVRSGLLPRITTILANYRQLLVDNGGDLPLTRIFDRIRDNLKKEREQLLAEEMELLDKPQSNNEILQDFSFEKDDDLNVKDDK